MIKSRRGSKGGKFFPGELISSIKEIIDKSFKDKIRDSKLIIDGCNFGNELVLKVEIEKSDGSKTSIELSIDYQSNELLQDKIHVLLDALGHFLDKVLTKKKPIIGSDWEEVKIGPNTLHARQVN